MSTKLDTLWTASAVLHRGPIDDPVLVDTGGVICTIEGEGTHSDQLMEENATNYLAEILDEDPNDLTIVSLTWSTLEVPAHAE